MKSVRISKGRAAVAAALALAVALVQPLPALAAHGGGGFHGGGFHAGGFSGGGFHGGGFHSGGFHGEFGRAHFDHFQGRGYGGGLLWGVAPFAFDDDYGAALASPGEVTQYWYYCSDPAGYYPYVGQCSTAWQPVPAS